MRITREDLIGSWSRKSPPVRSCGSRREYDNTGFMIISYSGSHPFRPQGERCIENDTVLLLSSCGPIWSCRIPLVLAPMTAYQFDANVKVIIKKTNFSVE